MAWDSAQSFGDDALQSNVARKGIAAKAGTAAQNDAYTGVVGEITMDTTTGELRVHDGATAGGNIVQASREASDGILHVQDQKAANTAGGATVAATLTDRVLNTVVTNTITGASLSSNAVTLPAGTYDVVGRSPCFRTNLFKSILYSDTQAATLLVGSNAFSSQTAAYGSHESVIRGRITLSAEDTMVLQYISEDIRATNGLGALCNLGSLIEVYGELHFTKIILL